MQVLLAFGIYYDGRDSRVRTKFECQEPHNAQNEREGGEKMHNIIRVKFGSINDRLNIGLFRKQKRNMSSSITKPNSRTLCDPRLRAAEVEIMPSSDRPSRGVGGKHRPFRDQRAERREGGREGGRGRRREALNQERV